MTVSSSIAEDGELESQRLPAPIRFPDGADQPGRFILHKRRADDSNATAGAAHSLAARPGTLAGSLSMVRREGVEPSRH